MWKKVGAIWLLILFFIQPIYGAVATERLTVEEAAYRLTLSPGITFQIDEPIDHRHFVEQISRAYSGLEGFKHHLKYFYYVEAPDTYFIQITAEENRGVRKGETLKEVQRIAREAAKFEKTSYRIAYVNNYLVQHVHYDYRSVDLSNALNSQSDLSPWSAEGALLDGLAVCEGYAGAFMLICRELGIPCIKVTGELEGMSHAWNAVYLSDEKRWIHIDVTNNGLTYIGLDLQSISIPEEALEKGPYIWEPDKLLAMQDMVYPFLLDNRVEELRALGLVVGRGDGDVALSEGLTRNELAALIVRMTGIKADPLSGHSTFSDVADWAQESVAACQAAGLLVGFPDNTFRGDAVVSKQEWAAIVLRLTGVPGSEYNWDTVEKKAVIEGLVSAGRTSHIHSREARRGDVFDSMHRLLNRPILDGKTLRSREIL